jgi:UDP-N-acetylglucosamine 2-epimerase (non-hydrolysing)
VKKILIAFGTRPEAIKMAPLINEFKRHKNKYDVRICVTGQHRELLDQVLEFFEIVPDYDLKLMKSKQDLSQLSAAVIEGMKIVLDSFKPDFLFVHGDTTTSTFAALAGFYAGVKVCHVEAGLRTYNLNFPFPEEGNRQLTSRLTYLHFTPTSVASANLLKEGIEPRHICLTGNTIIDALLFASKKIEKIKYPQIETLKRLINTNRPVVLVTCHRRENFGQHFEHICSALKHIAETNDVQLIYPVHLNPNIHDTAYQIIGNVKNITLVEPLDYPTFVWLMKIANFIITDSGGIQEEGTALGKSILLMRTCTERPELVDSGLVKLVGSDPKAIINEATALLANPHMPQPVAIQSGPYGKGDSAKQILAVLDEHIL